MHFRHAALALLLASGPAAAQYDTGPPVDYHVMNQWVIDASIQASIEDGVEGEPAADEGATREDGAEVVAFAAPEAFAFTPDPAMRAAAVEEVAASLEATVPQAAAALRGADAFGLLRQVLGPLGLSTDNLADASAVFIGEVYDAANGATTPASRETALALREQMAAGMTARAGMTGAEMQALSDRLYLQALVVNALRMACVGEAAGSEGCAEIQADAAASARAILGFEAVGASLGPEGLRPASSR